MRWTWKPEWTEEESRILAENYATKSHHELIKLLPMRTRWGIKGQARKLGLKKTLPFFQNINIPSTSSVNKLTEGWKGYLAGLIDGEGTIGLYRNKSEPFAHPLVEVNNTSLGLLKEVRETVGAGIVRVKQRFHNSRQKTNWLYNIRRIPDVRELLSQIKDYLILKKSQADFTLRYLNLRLINTTPTYEMEKLVEEVHKLNKRGPT